MTPKSTLPNAANPPWWQTGLIYQIYIRSFYDSNGDGVGDIKGVTQKLDYVQDLGVNGIWLSPVTASANVDWGYDVTDYYSIEPTLGTMEDFDELIEECTKRGIKVLMDFVPNHTSSKHPWFQNALTGRHAQYRDYYIWADPKKDGRPPNNWKAYYGASSAWSYHSPSGQYYLHNFFKEQPDLNWRNPAVREEFDRIMRFWLDRGIAGFRLDVVNMLIKDAKLRDNPKSTDRDGMEVRLLGQRPLHNISQPELHEILKHWRTVADSYKERKLLLGESTLVYNTRQLLELYGAHDELELAFNLKFIQARFDAAELKKVVRETEDSIASPDWPMWTASNHDSPRFPTRWAKGDERKIRCGLLMLLALRGTPILYYGDELGMESVFIAPWRLKDPRGKRSWPVEKGRDNARTPMPWEVKVGAGFTREDVRPWLPYGPLEQRSVEAQEREPDSTLAFTKKLIELRRRTPDLNLGVYKEVKTARTLWAWRRGEHTQVVLNLSGHHHELKATSGKILLGTAGRKDEIVDGILHLDPWEGVVLELAPGQP